MTEHNLEEFEYSRGDLRIRLRKPSAGVVVSAPRMLTAPEIIIPGSVEAPQPASGGSSALGVRSSEDLHLVQSPIVDSPDVPPPHGPAQLHEGLRAEAGRPLKCTDKGGFGQVRDVGRTHLQRR